MRYDVTITVTKGIEGEEAARAYVTRTTIELEKEPSIEAALKGETYNRSGNQGTHLDNQYCHVDLKKLSISANGPLQDQTIKSFVKTVYDRARELQRLKENIELIADGLPSRKESD